MNGTLKRPHELEARLTTIIFFNEGIQKSVASETNPHQDGAGGFLSNFNCKCETESEKTAKGEKAGIDRLKAGPGDVSMPRMDKSQL